MDVFAFVHDGVKARRIFAQGHVADGAAERRAHPDEDVLDFDGMEALELGLGGIGGRIVVVVGELVDPQGGGVLEGFFAAVDLEDEGPAAASDGHVAVDFEGFLGVGGFEPVEAVLLGGRVARPREAVGCAIWGVGVVVPEEDIVLFFGGDDALAQEAGLAFFGAFVIAATRAAREVRTDLAIGAIVTGGAISIGAHFGGLGFGGRLFSDGFGRRLFGRSAIGNDGGKDALARLADLAWGTIPSDDTGATDTLNAGRCRQEAILVGLAFALGPDDTSPLGEESQKTTDDDKLAYTKKRRHPVPFAHTQSKKRRFANKV